MGKGLSPLQKEIIAILERWPKAVASGDNLQWETSSTCEMAQTGTIIDALGRGRTPANYAAVSKALDRLNKRELVAVTGARCCLPGKGFRYGLIVESVGSIGH